MKTEVSAHLVVAREAMIASPLDVESNPPVRGPPKRKLRTSETTNVSTRSARFSARSAQYRLDTRDLNLHGIEESAGERQVAFGDLVPFRVEPKELRAACYGQSDTLR